MIATRAGLTTVAPSTRALWLGWHADVAALGFAAVLLLCYATAVWRLRHRGLTWPVRHSCAWLGGAAAMLFVTTGGPGRYGSVLLWMFTVQVVVVLFVVPVLLTYGRPLALLAALRASSGTTHTNRLRRGHAAFRVVGHPLVGPIVIPAIVSLVYFTPILSAALTRPAVRDLVMLILLLIGAVVAAGLVGHGDAEQATPLALATLLGIGLGELLLDAIPGIVLIFHATLISSPAWAGRHRAWAPSPHQDQTHAGSILWAVAEAVDIPFLIITARRLMRADALEAARADQETSDLTNPSVAGTRAQGEEATELPWWQVDPDRLRGHLLYRQHDCTDRHK